MTDYEKGSPAWDIGMILTRHTDSCSRNVNLRYTAANRSKFPTGQARLESALATPCDCGAGDNKSERTSIGSRKVNAAA